MYKSQRIIALIPARGGSKGIKDKNIIEIYQKPLIAYSIETALGSKYIDKVIVTTDSLRIAEIAKKYGAEVPFIRPKELAQDDSKTIDVVLHSISFMEEQGEKYDVIVLLQPTQPLRTVEDVDGAIELFFMKNFQGVVSVSEVDDPPLLIRTISDGGELNRLLPENSTCRRQDMPKYYRVNGCIYINRVSDLSEETSFNDNPIGYVMEKTHSVDIDELKDVALMEFYLNS